ncbi:DUF6114 domain-containing protein [Streptomyces sp. NBC_01242]|uniref:DUF6114 domain-containing protein n=1 Tax=unclassified Streptomyces TaxID=2593676 RepID=UPI00224DBAB4|nr:DUF6114 domain-containing protein [Streptomyces sp. NBC_01242]MCX4794829.1 DUF6114 domain-containing protein [Streptomyces sp. NBC_01242]WSP57588.1 DUF6114 domain-containing protein [Streptomyces sp. NBC_01241]
MSAETTGTRDFTYWRLRFRDWRQTRPFWAGLFTALGGGPIAYFPYANLKLGHLTLAMATTAGAGSLIIGVLLVTLGLTMWYQQIVRVFSGVATILLALVSIPVSNLGGFFLGFLFALVGGCLALSWAPGEPGAETESGGHTAGKQAEEPQGGEAAGVELPEQRATAAYDPGGAPWSDDVPSGIVDANGGRNSAG